jgi:hypothetical protein
MPKTIDQLLSEDLFFTLPYYCNAPEQYMRQKIKELVVKFFEENKEHRTEYISNNIMIRPTTAEELLLLVSDSTKS